MQVRVAIVDDHHVFREALCAALAREQDLVVVAEAENVERARGLLAESEADVVLLDVSMPGLDGVSAARDLVGEDGAARILFLTMHGKPEVATDAFVAGASGYALKVQHLGEIVSAIRTVAVGGTYLAPTLPRSILDEAQRRKLGGGDKSGPLAALSMREREVFRLAARGLSNDDISRALGISVRTVETHRAHFNRKLGLHSPADLVRFAATHDLLVD